MQRSGPERAGHIKQTLGIMREEVPARFLLWVNDNHVFTKQIQTLPLSYDRGIRLWEVQKTA
jgi:hypothetical protein